ncbi:hypothetical protein TPAR_04742 [Tolypocladium paradoxum]|uniref:Uncharacterized protein n=1 Tax=Tolypocladium paradoxum TaxID=94208 RepID=A0A2S4KY28_9HYPO|nr:hypothetical protein TPAR_04742 [Tolypocladium paradoxum]
MLVSCGSQRAFYSRYASPFRWLAAWRAMPLTTRSLLVEGQRRDRPLQSSRTGKKQTRSLEMALMFGPSNRAHSQAHHAATSLSTSVVRPAPTPTAASSQPLDPDRLERRYRRCGPIAAARCSLEVHCLAGAASKYPAAKSKRRGAMRPTPPTTTAPRPKYREHHCKASELLFRCRV